MKKSDLTRLIFLFSAAVLCMYLITLIFPFTYTVPLDKLSDPVFLAEFHRKAEERQEKERTAALVMFAVVVCAGLVHLAMSKSSSRTESRR